MMNLFTNLFGMGLPHIDPREAHQRLQVQPKPLLLDVRTPEEFAAAHAPGATLIPLNELKARLAEVPANREVLCICASGSRSSVATRQLQAAGRQATNISGGMGAWARQGLPIKRGRG
jgi:rhodanese-related sulfurtransferase